VHGVRHELLRLPQVAVAGGAVVQAARGQDVGEEGLVAEHLDHAGIGPAPLLVAGRRIDDVAPPAELEHRLEDGRAGMIHTPHLPR
jgi:hypothetical protein